MIALQPSLTQEGEKIDEEFVGNPAYWQMILGDVTVRDSGNRRDESSCVLTVHELLAGKGGAERYVRAVSAALAEAGFRLAFLTAPHQRLDSPQGPVYALRPSFGWRSGRQGRRELEEVLDAAQPDLVFIQDSEEFMSPLLLKNLGSETPLRALCPRCSVDLSQPD